MKTRSIPRFLRGTFALCLASACAMEDEAPDDGALRYASSDATRLEAGIFEWWVLPGDDSMLVRGLGRDGAVDAELVLRTEDGTVEIEMIFPEPGIARVDLATETLVGTLPHPELVTALQADMSAHDGDEPRSHNSWSCWAATGAATVSCYSAYAAPTPVTIAACAAATVSAAAACSGAHCDQIQCNAMCVSGGHSYGWCASEDPWSCGCHGTGIPAGGGGGEGGGGGGGGNGGGCVSDWDCPSWAYCLSGVCS